MFIIKSYRTDGSGRRHISFWQVPWGINTPTGWVQETGGWVHGSRYATLYADPTEAERVILIRGLEAEVDESRPSV